MKKTHCKRGHLRSPENLYAGGACKECSIAYAKENYRKNPELFKKRAKLWNEKNPRDQNKERARFRKYHKDHPEVGRRLRLKDKGWTPLMVEEKKKEQNNSCAICKKKFVETPHADHKHVVPPEPRGLLCHHCNVVLGFVFEDTKILRNAIKYINKYK
jgi:hypothetical protein